MQGSSTSHQILDAIRGLDLSAVSIAPLIDDGWRRSLKFADSLPDDIATNVLEARLDARSDADKALRDIPVVHH